MSDIQAIHHGGFPCLVIHGRHDIVTPPACGQRLAVKLKCPLVLLEGAHFLTRDQAPAVNQLLAGVVFGEVRGWKVQGVCVCGGWGMGVLHWGCCTPLFPFLFPALFFPHPFFSPRFLYPTLSLSPPSTPIQQAFHHRPHYQFILGDAHVPPSYTAALDTHPNDLSPHEHVVNGGGHGGE